MVPYEPEASSTANPRTMQRLASELNLEGGWSVPINTGEGSTLPQTRCREIEVLKNREGATFRSYWHVSFKFFPSCLMDCEIRVQIHASRLNHEHPVGHILSPLQHSVFFSVKRAESKILIC